MNASMIFDTSSLQIDPVALGPQSDYMGATEKPDLGVNLGAVGVSVASESATNSSLPEVGGGLGQSV